MGKYYKTGYVTQSILDFTPTLEELDTRKRDKSGNLVSIHSADAYYPQAKGTPQQYKDLDINYYRNFNEFYTAMRGLAEDQSHRIKKPIAPGNLVATWYEQYLRRDFLIATGQYKGAMNVIYKDTFTKAVEESLTNTGLTEQDRQKLGIIRRNMLSLAPTEFDKLTRDPDEPSKATTFIKAMFEFYSAVGSQAGDEVTTETYYDALKQYFERNGLKWLELEKEETQDKDDEGNTITVPYAPKSMYEELQYVRANKFNSAASKSMIKTASRIDLETLVDEEIAEELVAGKLLYEKQVRAESKGRSYIKHTKAGKAYVPFAKRENSDAILASYVKYLTYINK